MFALEVLMSEITFPRPRFQRPRLVYAGTSGGSSKLQAPGAIQGVVEDVASPQGSQ